MQGNDIDLDLGKLGKLQGRVGRAVVLDLERSLGGIISVIRRFTLNEGSFGECGAIVHRLLVEASPKTAPSREEVDDAILDLGLSRSIDLVLPFLERVMTGAEDGTPSVE